MPPFGHSLPVMPASLPPNSLSSLFVLCILPLAVACSTTRTEVPASPAPAPSDSDAPNDGEAEEGAPDEFVDPRDDRVYPTITFGNTTWLARNLNFAIDGSSFCYDDRPSNCEEHGRLYLWSVARTACPPEWHLGTDSEWQALEASLGMDSGDIDVEGYSTARGTNEGTLLKNDGFGAKLAGFRTGATYEALDERTYFWTATKRGSEVWRRRISADEPTIFRFTNPPASFAISVRCVKD
jgi:uncharacterized protein (TIGR02145 family)